MFPFSTLYVRYDKYRKELYNKGTVVKTAPLIKMQHKITLYFNKGSDIIIWLLTQFSLPNPANTTLLKNLDIFSKQALAIISSLLQPARGIPKVPPFLVVSSNRYVISLFSTTALMFRSEFEGASFLYSNTYIFCGSGVANELLRNNVNISKSILFSDIKVSYALNTLARKSFYVYPNIFLYFTIDN